MDRRKFLKNSVASVTLALGSGLALSACGRDLRSDLMRNDQISGTHAIEMLNPDGYKILFYASCAPSGHNSQPWFVRINSRLDWVVGSDSNHWLEIVDGDNREALLSIGAFVENLVQAAAAFGYEVVTSILANDRQDSDVVGIRLKKSPHQMNALKRIITRRTVKSHMLDKDLNASDIEDLIESGRRFQRMALVAREKMVAIHPMTQTLEEKRGQKNIRENHHPTTIPQFMLRVGYLEKYPDPVSLRRPVEWFVRA